VSSRGADTSVRPYKDSVMVQCELCPKGCVIEEGGRGNCRVRVNIDGKLRAVTYGRPCSIHIDPIEKKPFFHFLPGTNALSVACAGCNLHCKNCQNWEISQSLPEDIEAYRVSPQELAAMALKEKTPSIAYTYGDPIAFYEYTLDTSRLSQPQGTHNVLVTSGYIRPEPMRTMLKTVDAVKLDFKFFDDALYRQICDAALEPVLATMRLVKDSGVWLEIVHLLIPTLNDSPAQVKAFCGWIADNLGSDVPLHFSRFYPHYLLKNLPETPAETLLAARAIAIKAGLHYVYVGNIYSGDWENTYCPQDKTLLIKRTGYLVAENHLKDGKCPSCGQAIPGVWK